MNFKFLRFKIRNRHDLEGGIGISRLQSMGSTNQPLGDSRINASTYIFIQLSQTFSIYCGRNGSYLMAISYFFCCKIGYSDSMKDRTPGKPSRDRVLLEQRSAPTPPRIMVTATTAASGFATNAQSSNNSSRFNRSTNTNPISVHTFFSFFNT